MRDEPRADDIANERSQVRGNDTHLLDEVRVQRFPVVGEVDDSLGKGHDVLHVSFRNVLAHAVLGGIDDVARKPLVIIHQGCEVVQLVFRQGLLVPDEERHLGIAVVLRDDLDELGEMPRVPFAHAHGERVDGLVELVNDCDGLDDVVVVALYGELDLCARVGMTQTELRGIHVAFPEPLQQLRRMHADAAQHVLHHIAGVDGFALNVREGGLNARRQHFVVDAQANLVLLARLGQVQLEKRDQRVGRDAFGNVIDLAERLLVVSNRELALAIPIRKRVHTRMAEN